MSRYRIDWTDEMLVELERRWLDGENTRVIADKIGVTKNAVIGKAHRMGLASRPSPIKKKQPPTWESDDKKIKGSTDRSPALALVGQPVVKPVVTGAGTLYRRRAGAVNLKTCQWIEGEPSADDKCKCGEPVLFGMPYCKEHYDRSWRLTWWKRKVA